MSAKIFLMLQDNLSAFFDELEHITFEKSAVAGDYRQKAKQVAARVGKMIRSADVHTRHALQRGNRKLRNLSIRGYVALPEKMRKHYEHAITNPLADPSDHTVGLTVGSALGKTILGSARRR